MNAITSPEIALIGGTGLYQLAGLEDLAECRMATPWGEPSDVIMTGLLHGRRLAFVARHGGKHSIAPHQINYRANLHALKELGATRVIGINAVGGIRDDMGPRVLVVPDQIIDYTHGRITSFSDGGDVAVRHIDFSEPYSASMRKDLIEACAVAVVDVVDGGCYGATQGPRLETRAEIARMKRDGCDLVGMTGMPEAALARELDLDYACLALVANWAAGCGDEAEISLDEIFANLEQATSRIPLILEALLKA